MTKTRGQKNIPVKNCRLDLMVLKTNHHVKILQHSEKHDKFNTTHQNILLFMTKNFKLFINQHHIVLIESSVLLA